ncbi:MAG TPA: helix-turn-helix domain-containing protein, partial [Polyangiaceae bacterium]|nr:helix-turn-helix domain-containing protein [Polyangiaceae bacterium]
FERYLEAVALRAGHRLDAARAHLEAGFERVAERLLEGGALDAKSFSSLQAGLERASVESGTVHELFSAYRRAVADVCEAAQESGPARQHRSLRRAEAYIRQHYSESLSLQRVARVAGFAPTYFSELFHQKQQVTFEHYVTKLRVERARQLLSSTALNLQRVAQLTGFSGRQYFGHVFKRWTGETPMGYRRRVRKQLAD